MTYVPVKRPLEAFGYALRIGTPVGDQIISIPFEQIATDVANIAINAAWPLAKTKLYEELPTFANAAMNAAKPYFEAEVKKVSELVDQKTTGITGSANTLLSKATRNAAILVGVLAATGVGVAAFMIISRKKHAKVAA